jgi:hypothetical protein
MDEREFWLASVLVPRAEDLPKIRALLQAATADDDRDWGESLKTLSRWGGSTAYNLASLGNARRATPK